MKIISVNNNHVRQKEIDYGYGCVCSKCGSVFTFERSDAIIPRCINPDPTKCLIKCPNCYYTMTLNKCEKFKSEIDKLTFESKYSK